MSPKEALQVIDQALSQISATRETHTLLLQAMGILSAEIGAASTAQAETQEEK